MRLPPAVALALTVSSPALLDAAPEERMRRIALPTAGRVPTPFPFTVIAGPNGTQWDLANTLGTNGGPFGGTCNGSSGVGVLDARTNTAFDPYDNGYTLYVEGLLFATGTADVTGSTVTAGPLTHPSGISVTRQLFFSPSRQVMRVLDTFQNPLPGNMAVFVQMPVNFGSDDGTVIEATSSGDLTFTVADRWLITSDGPLPSDPVNTTVLFGPGAPVTPFSVTETVFECAFPNGAGWTFNVTVPAQSTRRLMFYAGLENTLGTGNTAAGAIANAAVFDDAMVLHTTTDLTSGLTQTELQQVVNWDFSFLPVELQSFEVQ